MKFIVEVLSNQQADCFFISIENNRGDRCNIIIDGNRQGEKQDSFQELINKILDTDKIDFIVATHIDNDHIGGILSLYELCEREGKDYNEKIQRLKLKKRLEKTVIIYNTITKDVISYKQAQRFEELIRDKKVISSYQQRYENSNKFVQFLPLKLRRILNIDSEDKRETVYITFLGPDKEGVREINRNYRQAHKNANLINKNSIIMMVEFGDKKVLFTGDAYSEDVFNKVHELIEDNIPSPIIKIDYIKIPHHGAADYNKQLLDLAVVTKCNKFILTAKDKWDKKHPDKEISKKLLANIGGIQIYTQVDLLEIDGEFVNSLEKGKIISIIG